MSYLGRSAKLSLKAQEKVSFLATAGQTNKTGLSYVPNFVEVYVNGILLTDTTDFTATNGNSVTFTVALALNDEVTVVSLKTFTVADHYTKSQANALLAAKETVVNVALKAPLASPSFTGGVGIGTSSPTSPLHITGSGHTALTITGGTSSDAQIRFGDSANTTIGMINYDNAINALKFVVNGSTAAIIDNAGHAIIGGGVTLGNGSTYAAANTLDDYEEGTWSPRISDGTNDNAAYSQQTGKYVKVGNAVTIQGRVATTTLNSVTGNLLLSNLPFTNGSVFGTIAVSYARDLNITAGQSVSGFIGPNSTNVSLRIWNTNVGSDYLNSTQWTSNGHIMFSATYAAF